MRHFGSGSPAVVRRLVMALGFAAAFTGDWFLVVRGCGVRDAGFLCGVAAFSCAHLLWAAANVRESRIEWKVLPVVLVPVCGFFVARIWGVLPDVVWFAAVAYAAMSACSLAVAVGTRRWCYALGTGCLVLSDVFIACRWAHAPHWGALVGPVYVAALLLVMASLALDRREPRFACGQGDPLPMTVLGGLLSLGFFLWAMAACPGGHYNPLFKMLSYLGRTAIGEVRYPLSHYLFCLGMMSGAAASLCFAPHFRALVPGRVRKEVIGWGMSVCVAGLLLIAMVPENERIAWHLYGCDLTMVGGIPMAFALAFDRMGKMVLAWMILVSCLFGAALLLHATDVLPFAPYVPTMQKVVIVSFIVWQLAYAVRIRRRNRGSQFVK